MFAFPRLNIEGGPERNEQDVEIVYRRVNLLQVCNEIVLVIRLVNETLFNLYDEDDTTNDGRYEDPGYVVQYEGDVKGILRTIVISDEIDRLKMGPETACQ